ncbi:hypothetical protein OAT37_02500 [Alphaproteobacteria bacterium]|nr:hypothetical protein [Alphaproteobacteria bacterium]
MTKAIIIDADIFDNVFSYPCFNEIRKRIDNGELKLINCEGTKLSTELSKKQIYIELARLGSVTLLDKKCVDQKLDQLRCAKRSQNDLYKSNDVHILAVTLVSKTNVLATRDHKLMNDFGNCRTICKKIHNGKKCGCCGQINETGEQKTITYTQTMNRPTPAKSIKTILNAAKTPQIKCGCGSCPCH